MNLGRSYAVGLAVNLPVLAVLLIPQLMRSRAGSETLLALGTALLLTLVIGAVIIAPGTGSSRPRVRELIRQQPKAYAWRLGEFIALYVAAQCVGALVALVRPYIWSNPDHGIVAGASPWVISYPNFALQAVSIYLVICLATAWYGARLRQLDTRHRRSQQTTALKANA